jgi:hypothetical protein
MQFLVLGWPVAAYAGWPVGSRIDDSVVVDVTDEGFASAEGLVGVFLPPRVDVPAVSQADEGGCFLGFCAYSYSVYADGIYAEIAVNDLALVPGTEVLNLQATAIVTVNSSADPAPIDIQAELAEIEVFDDICNLHVDPVTVNLNGAIQLQLVDDPFGVDIDGDGSPDTKKLDVVVPPLGWSWNASGDHIKLEDCGLDTINDITSFLGFDLYQILLDQVEPQIDDLVNELPAELEPTLEEAFAGLIIDQELDLLGVPMHLTLWPEALDIQSGGLRISLSSVTDVPVNDCVAQYGITESASTPSALPGIGEAPASVPFVPHLAAAIDDDFINHVLYGVWAGGLLCFDLEDGSESLDLPLPINTSLLALMAPGVFDDMFPETSALAIRTSPTQPPYVVAEGPHDVNVVADGLGLEFFVDVDGRKTRLMGLDLRADLGLDLDFDDTTGALALNTTELDGGAFAATVAYNEFKPDQDDVISDSFANLFDLLVAPLLGDALTGLSFSIPAFEGVGITALVAEPTGENGDMLGAFVSTGPVSYASTGCDEGGGCDESGCESSCDSGCATGNPPARIALLVFPLVAAWLRRKRY